MNFSFSSRRCTLAALLAILLTSQAQAAPGDLDLTFGSGTGMVGDSMGTVGALGRSVVIDTSNRIVVAGTALNDSAIGRFALLRLNPDGSRDAGFGTDGRSIHAASATSNDDGHGLILQADGKLVMAGISFDFGPDSDFAALKINTDGSVDTSFGNHGNGWMTTGRAGSDAATSLAVDATGGFVLGGFVSSASLLDAAGLRLDANGAIDLAYGSSGMVLGANDSNSFYSVAAQPDGKAVLGGHIDSNGGAIVQRFNADGSADASFAGDGRAELNGVLDTVGGLYLLADGRILAAGMRVADARIVRLNANGTIDPSFGVAGSLTVTAASLGVNNAVLQALTLDGDGRIVATGYAIHGSNGSQLLALRGLSNGQIDVAFGNAGTRLIDGEGDLIGNAIAVQADGAIVIAGTDQSTSPEVPDQMLVVRLEGGGSGGGAMPALSIADASLTEGDSGSTVMNFSVNLSAPSDGSVSVDIATDLGSASAGVDYTPTTAVAVNFPNGTSNVSFQVPVIGDLEIEGNETLLVRLSNPVNATLADAEAIGTILNDDTAVAPAIQAAHTVPGPRPFVLAALGLLLIGSAFVGVRWGAAAGRA